MQKHDLSKISVFYLPTSSDDVKKKYWNFSQRTALCSLSLRKAYDLGRLNKNDLIERLRKSLPSWAFLKK